ncbi:DHA1 family putative efflux transporter-like MFS transporter [Paenibacillus endophyticus]|uniref:DHA1 family putative efflux transporter-like MFS transporter n=1 Tax=Paenibacillus endophyticus TaxID=1294268 RepID=A0A7W5GBN3_9BACL|nr:MFS transporter [Paenibacillus endophyticus]MBB3153578.1 DHA1 family putative efflux transporter-like MFS transporter [Paenibacillus endophyticus]
MSNAWKIYMLAIISFLVGTSEFIIAGILDKVASDVGVSVSAAGQLITVFSLAYAFGTPILMAVTARMERRSLLLYSLGVFAVGNLIAVLLPGFAFLIVSRIVLALSTGVFVVTALTVASKLAPAGKQGSAIATLVMGFSTALIIGVPLGRLAASVYDWKLIFGAIGLLGLLAMLIIVTSIPQSDGEAPVPIRKQLSLLKQPKIAIALTVTFLWIGGYSIVYTYISPFLLTVTKLTEQGVSIGLFAFGIASLIGSKIGGFSTDKWGAPRTLVSGMLFHTVALVLLSFAGQSQVIVFPLLMLWAFTAWSSGPTQQYHLMSLAPEASGIMLSLNSSVLQLGMAAGAGLGGVIVEQASLTSITWIGATGVILAAATAATFFGVSHSRSRRKELERTVVVPAK